MRHKPLREQVVVVTGASKEQLIDVVMQTRAMLDMIITVVGEYYGQKDLLQEREIWEDSTEGSG